MSLLFNKIYKVVKRVTKKNSAKLHEPIFMGKENAYLKDCIKTTFVSTSGKYIKMLFRDDYLYLDCIEKMILLAESHKELEFIFSLRDPLKSLSFRSPEANSTRLVSVVVGLTP